MPDEVKALGSVAGCYWRAREILEDHGFTKRADGSFTKTTILSNRGEP